MVRKLKKIYWLCQTQLGVDPIKALRSICNCPSYIRDAIRFRAKYKGRFEFIPCLQDKYEEGGVTRSEYFWQDLLVAKMIFEANPKKHVDIGSRIDGFVAHVASFREIEVFDVRPITTKIPGLIFKQIDFMKPLPAPLNENGYCDSLSCLHAIEHFGLGRYGDRIDPNGYEDGIENMSKLLKTGGTFYLSIPIGQERVEFNANRVFNPVTIVNVCGKNGLNMVKNFVIKQNGGIESSCNSLHNAAFYRFSKLQYRLGIFIFVKVNS